MLFKRPHTESIIKLDTSRGWATQGPNESTKTVPFHIDHCKTAVKGEVSMHTGLKPQKEAHFLRKVRQTAARSQKATAPLRSPLYWDCGAATKQGHQARPPSEAPRRGHQAKPPNEATRRGHQARPQGEATKRGHTARPPSLAAS